MTTFDQFGLNSQILQAISELGFVNPTPIQEKVIPHLLESQEDLIGLAQTGTGKTAAFGLPLLNQIDTSVKTTQFLILSPTRELCMQIHNDLEAYSKYQKNVNMVAVYGGASIENQIRKIKSGVHIIVATPGRMLDLLKRKAANISGIRTIILDEADEMLNMGFREDLEEISSFAPKQRQTLLFSATMPKEVAALSKVYLTDPVEITAGKANTGALSVEHHCYVMQEKDRYSVLRRIVDYYPGLYAIVFCRTRAECQHVAGLLMKDGYPADALHGDLSQSQRDYAMSRFRNKALQILVATDVAARGIDVNNLTHVLNYNLPDDIDTYLHRSGRTGRANNKGISAVLVNVREKFKVKHLERKVSQSFVEMQIPNGKEICEKRIMHQIDEVVSLSQAENTVDYISGSYYEKFADLSKEEIIKRFLSLQFNEMFAKYQNVPNLNVSGHSDRGEDRGDYQRSSKSGFTRMFINIGRIDGFDKQMMRDFVKDITENSKLDVGDVDIRDRFSIFVIPDSDVAVVKKSFAKIMFDNRPLRVDEMDRSDSRSSSGSRVKKEGSYSDRSSSRSSRSGTSEKYNSGRSDRGKSYSSPKKSGGDRDGDRKRRSSKY
jgi:ATP-dependent RNA helicase DeaD